jgi:hypothetical protein
MPTVRIDIDIAPTVQFLTELQQEQVPYAVSRAVNDIAVEVQNGIRAGMNERFTIRKAWVLMGVKIPKFSNKRDNPISVTVEIAPDRDFMNKFEAGGQKFPRVGSNIAVPTPAVRPSKSGIVPNSMRPRAFGFQTTTTKRGAAQTKGDQRTFIIDNGRTPGIYQRTGSKSLRLLYKFFKSVPIPMSLRFQDSAKNIVNNRFDEIFAKRLAEALRTAKRK